MAAYQDVKWVSGNPGRDARVVLGFVRSEVLLIAATADRLKVRLDTAIKLLEEANAHVGQAEVQDRNGRPGVAI